MTDFTEFPIPTRLFALAEFQGPPGDVGPKGDTGDTGPKGDTGDGGDPGGADTQVQFNDGGVFGGDSGLVYNKPAKSLTLGGGTLTTDSPVLAMAQTWNASGTTFTGLKMNVTDTASAAASNLLDLQVGGVSSFSVAKNGEINSPTNIAPIIYATEIRGSGGATSGQWLQFIGNGIYIDRVGRRAGLSRFGVDLHTTSHVAWASLNNAEGAKDLSLFRDAADTLAQRRDANAQAFNLYNTFTDASNHERARLGWAGNAFEIKPEAAGTGTTRVVHISGLPTSNPGPGILWNDGGTVKVGT